MDPRQVANTFMCYYLNGNQEPMPVNVNLNSEDNEMTIQILLTVYNEMHNIWYEHPQLIESVFLDILKKSFLSLGFNLNIINSDELVHPEDIIHYASITPYGTMLLNPFHPINIANIMTKEGESENIPEAYTEIIKNPAHLPYIVAYHNYGTNSSASTSKSASTDIISFSLCV